MSSARSTASLARQRGERGKAFRRRVILAAVFLAAFILLFRLILLAGEFDTVVTAARFAAARDDHTALRAFLYRMPKGGDLHTHLAGAVYAGATIWRPRSGK